MKKFLALIFMGAFIMAHTNAKAFDIYSTDFQNNTFLASRHASCDGMNISPDLDWGGIPANAASLALVVHDTDSAGPYGFYHWIVVDIPPHITGITEGEKFASPAREIDTDFGMPGYNGPCPPVGYGPHHYHFTLYALDVPNIELAPGLKPHEVEAIIKSHAVAGTTIIGLYERK
jgi:Raf kinase inhibitor-like YbhB/YbcL family protein